MNIRSIKRPLASIVIFTHLVAYSIPAVAAPGTLADAPLFLSTAVEPNIFFLNDDSGSMDWEIMTTDLANGGRFTGTQPDGTSPAGSGSVKHRDSNDDGTANCDFNDGTFYGYFYGVEFGNNSYNDNSYDCNTADDEAWRFRNSDFNPLYFDPNKTYEPWKGVDINGNPYTDADVTNAPNDPYNPTEYIDLTVNNANWTSASRLTSDRDGDGIADGFRYYTWSDADADGEFDDGEETEHLIKDESAAVQQNFANWFTYHRSREFVTKYALSKIIAETNGVRMGYGAINQNNSVNIEIASMNSDPTSGNKKALLDKVFSTHSSGGTPVRENYELVGDYYESGTSAGTLFSSAASSPILSAANGGTCQLNFGILFSDGFYNGNDPSVGNADGDDDTSFDGDSYADSESDTLADIAMHYYERDLNNSLANEVPVSPGVDDADHQHLVTYSVAFGVTGSLDPFDTETPGNDTDTEPTDSGFSWPDPNNGDAEKIDDLWHAAYNGRGQFLSAQDPDGLITALENTMDNIADRTSSASAVAFNSTKLGTGSYVYQARFNTSEWSGDLLAFELDANDGSVSSTPDWNAAAQLDNRNLSTAPRTILTYDGTAGIPFQWADITTAQKNDLKTNPSGGTDSDTIGEQRLDFLRGDRSNEGAGSFRIRNSRLGDIVHANPVYVGDPQLGYPDTAPVPTAIGDRYSDFKSAQSGRDGVIYVGANDGMLHGIDADTGDEVLGYIPNNLFSTSTTEGLHYLSDPNYSHRYYVDLSPSVSDAYILSTASETTREWTTVLIGGERGGGRGLFALDVTDPTSFSESGSTPDDMVMWEFTNSDDADLGYTFSEPTIALTNGLDGSSNNRWAAIFGNGYNDTGSGEAKLFIVFLEGGLDGDWTDTGDYVKITTGVGDTSDRNGLATPNLVDLDKDGVVDRVYAGDLKGNMWAFDLTDTDATNWESAYSQGSTPKPLFTATDAASNPQPITSKPVALIHPTEPTTTSPSNEPNLMLYFGTGQYLVSGDKTTTATQTFYAVWDKGDKERSRSELVEQTFESGFPSNVRVPTDNAVNYSSKYGWFIDLPDSGERVVADAKVRGDLVFFNTLIPSSQPCSFGGSGWLMSVKQPNGGPPDEPAFDLDGDLDVDDDDKVTNDGGATYDSPAGHKFDEGIPAESNFLGDHQYTPGSSGEIQHDVIDVGDSDGQGRLSWREVRF